MHPRTLVKKCTAFFLQRVHFNEATNKVGGTSTQRVCLAPQKSWRDFHTECMFATIKKWEGLQHRVYISHHQKVGVTSTQSVCLPQPMASQFAPKFLPPFCLILHHNLPRLPQPTTMLWPAGIEIVECGQEVDQVLAVIIGDRRVVIRDE